MKFINLIFFFFSSFTYGQKGFNLVIRPVDSRIIYINNRNIPRIELLNLTTKKNEKLTYDTYNDTIEVFTYKAKIKKGKYLLSYENYYGENITDTISFITNYKKLIIYPDKQISNSTNFLNQLNGDTIFVRNEFQATRYLRNYNFSITNNNENIYLTTYFDRSYFPDTLNDKTPTLNGMSFVFDKPDKTLKLDDKQKKLVNNFLNELSKISNGGNWSSTDLYLHNLNKVWIKIIDNKNYWLGGQILLRQLKLIDY